MQMDATENCQILVEHFFFGSSYIVLYEAIGWIIILDLYQMYP